MLGLMKEKVEQQVKHASREDVLLLRYNEAKDNPNNLSFWYPKVNKGLEQTDVNIRVPYTEIEEFPFELYKMVFNSDFSLDTANAIENYFTSKKGEFIEDMGGEYFIKTGVYSDKFNFSTPHMVEGDSLGVSIMNLIHNSMVVGAPFSPEIAFRQFVYSDEDTIYEGMPLRTEFRVFYDFDEKKVLGIANYWHPDYMIGSGRLSERDLTVYKANQERLLSEYELHKVGVVTSVDELCENIDLTGKWSVDIMYEEGSYWLIDMALMHQSALIDVMEELSDSRQG